MYSFSRSDLPEPGLQHLELGVRVALEGDEEQPGGQLAGVGVLAVGVVVAAAQELMPPFCSGAASRMCALMSITGSPAVVGLRVVDRGELVAAGDAARR